jgi:hypothetical protein
MDERQRNSFGIGLIVGVIMFMAFSYGWFGMPQMDLVGSLGVGVGSGFSASIVAWMTSPSVMTT